MAENDFSTESAECFEQKWLCVFLIDLSMGHDSLKKLNKELSDFHRLVLDDYMSERLELWIATFGQGFELLRAPSSVSNITIPILNSDNIEVLIDSINKAIEKIEARKRWYKETGQMFYRPCLVLVTKEEKEALYNSASFARVIVGVEAQKYDILNYCMNGTCVFVTQGKVFSLRYKKTRNIFYMLSFIFRTWPNYNVEAPYCDYREDDVIIDDVLIRQVEAFKF